MIKTKQELLNHFSDINAMYNNPFMYQTLSNMIDELLEQQPSEDAISRKRLIILIDEGAELHPYKVVGDSETYSNYNQGWTDAFDWLYANIDCDNLPSVKPQPKIDEIISRIEEARDKDQIAEYPYNRCIKIIREVLGDD